MEINVNDVAYKTMIGDISEFEYVSLKGKISEILESHKLLGELLHKRTMFIPAVPFSMSSSPDKIEIMKDLQVEYYELGLKIKEIGLSIDKFRDEQESKNELFQKVHKDGSFLDKLRIPSPLTKDFKMPSDSSIKEDENAN